MGDEALAQLRSIWRRVQETERALDELLVVPDTPIGKKRIGKQGRREENSIYVALSRVSESLANSYLQVGRDIEDTQRMSWAGSAHEIREILASLLRILAPDNEVKVKEWYRQEPNTSGPTQKQRVRFILDKQDASSKEREVVGRVISIEDMVGDMVRATYSRASDAAHRFKSRREVIRILTYFEAFAHDLLDIED